MAGNSVTTFQVRRRKHTYLPTPREVPGGLAGTFFKPAPVVLEKAWFESPQKVCPGAINPSRPVLVRVVEVQGGVPTGCGAGAGWHPKAGKNAQIQMDWIFSTKILW